MRAAASKIEPKHEKEIAALIDSYKSRYSEWVLSLRYDSFLVANLLTKLMHFFIYFLYYTSIALVAILLKYFGLVPKDETSII